jgi:hypothetical protein
MKFEKLNIPQSLQDNQHVCSLSAYLVAMEKMVLDQSLIDQINAEIRNCNQEKVEKQFLDKLRKTTSTILNLVEKEAKIVPIGFYQKRWMVLGMAAFGIPFGVAFGSIFGNMAFIGIGIPFGLAIGIALGTSQDEKAKKEGRQLDAKVN